MAARGERENKEGGEELFARHHGLEGRRRYSFDAAACGTFDPNHVKFGKRDLVMGVRSALKLGFRAIARVYFRDIEVAGDVPRADTKSRLFAANHVNALVDPVLVLTHAPCEVSPIAKSTLFDIPGLRWLLDTAGAVPIVRRRDFPDKSASDNEAVFVKVAHHLLTGGNILIFPEGTSHNEPHLLALKSGAGRMLAKATAEARGADPKTSGASNLTFQAVALEFDERDIFRSRALVLFGPVRRVDDLDGRDLPREITEQIEADLSELLVEGKTWEERRLIVRVSEMFGSDASDTSLSNLNVVGRRIEQAKRILGDLAPTDVASIEGRLRGYLDRLDREELMDDVVAKVSRGEGVLGDRRESDRVVRAALMILTLPLAIMAAIVYWLPYQLPRFVAKRLKGDPDVTSTYKLGVGLVVYPVWAAILTTFAFLRLSSELAVTTSAALVAGPFCALAWLDRWDRLAAMSSLLAPSEERLGKLRELADERAELMRELETMRSRANV